MWLRPNIRWNWQEKNYEGCQQATTIIFSSKKVNINTFQNQRSLLLSVIAHNMGAPKISKNIVSTQSNACKLGRIVKQQVLFYKTIIMSFYHYHY